MVSTAACTESKRFSLAVKFFAAGLLATLSLLVCLPGQASAFSLDGLRGDLANAVDEMTAAATEVAEQEAKAAAVDPTTKVLAYDAEAVAAVSTQVETGHTSCCLAFSQAIGDTMMTGGAIDHTEYAATGNCAWCPYASYGDWTESTTDLSAVYDEINAGRPAVIHVSGNGSYEHWVLAFGYVGVDDPASMTLDNVYIIDPWDGAVLIASERFVRNGDCVIELTSKTASVCQ